MTSANSTLDQWQQLAAALRGTVKDLSATKLARSLDITSSALDLMMFEHRHKPAAREVAELRVRAATAALLGDDTRGDEAVETFGFASREAMDRALLDFNGLNAAGLEALDGCGRFELALPAHYRVAETVAYLARDPRSNNVARHCARQLTVALVFDKLAVSAAMTFGDRSVAIELDTRLDKAAAAASVSVFRRLLGFAAPTGALARRARTEPEIQRLIRGRRGLTVHQTATAWDALVWAVLGQQISLIAAYTLLRALSEAAGLLTADGQRTLPRPELVALMSDTELRACKLSKAKTKTLRLLASKIAAGELDLAALERGSAVIAREALSAQHGIGPWTANYVMMRGFGFADCAPVGDAGLRRALRQFLTLHEAPSDKNMSELMAPFAPHRSLATFHLWRGFDDALPSN